MDLITVWRGTDGDEAPVKLLCEVFGYPNKTTTGETMYVNTHFRTEEEAWVHILHSAQAGVSLSRRSVDEAQKGLAVNLKELDEACGRLERVLRYVSAAAFEKARSK